MAKRMALYVKARVTEVDALIGILLAIYDELVAAEGSVLAADEFLKGRIAELRKQYAALTAAIKQDRAVSRLEEADAARDALIRSLGTALAGYAALPVPERQDAAAKLRAVFDKYGKSITAESYDVETSLIESMLEDYAAEGLAEPISRLEGIADLLARLRAAQNSFAQAHAEYMRAMFQKGQSATALKKPLLAELNEKFIPYLSTMAMVHPEGYADFSGRVVAEVSRVNAAVSRRLKKTAADAPLPEEPPSEDVPVEDTDS